MAQLNQIGDDVLSTGKNMWRRRKQEVVQPGKTIQTLSNEIRGGVCINLDNKETPKNIIDIRDSWDN